MKEKTSDSFECGCQFPINRRAFLKTTVGGVAAAATACVSPSREERVQRTAQAAAKPQSDTLVATLYKSLSEEQQKALVLPFDDPLRSKVDNNWHIADKKISEFVTN